MKLNWLLGIMLGVALGAVKGMLWADVATPTVYIEPGCHTLDDLLTVTNKGPDIGWFEISRRYVPTEQLGSFIGLENVEKPEKRLYMAGSYNPVSQVFRGTNKIACYWCRGGGGGEGPNSNGPCPKNSADTNSCVTCVAKVPCKDVLTMVKCHATGGEARASTPLNQFPENHPESMRKKLDLVKPAQ